MGDTKASYWLPTAGPSADSPLHAPDDRSRRPSGPPRFLTRVECPRITLPTLRTPLISGRARGQELGAPARPSASPIFSVVVAPCRLASRKRAARLDSGFEPYWRWTSILGRQPSTRRTSAPP